MTVLAATIRPRILPRAAGSLLFRRPALGDSPPQPDLGDLLRGLSERQHAGRRALREPVRAGLFGRRLALTRFPGLESPLIRQAEAREMEALKQRILAGDHGGTIPWDDLAAELGL